MDFYWNKKTDHFIKVRSSASAQLISVEVESRPRMGALDPTLEFYLSLSVSFLLNGNKYICTKSPYSDQGIVTSLKNRILNGAAILVFFNPSCPNDANESRAIVEGILSWDEYKSLLEGKRETIPRVHTPMFSGVFLAAGILVCVIFLLVYISERI